MLGAALRVVAVAVARGRAVLPPRAFPRAVGLARAWRYPSALRERTTAALQAGEGRLARAALGFEAVLKGFYACAATWDTGNAFRDRPGANIRRRS